MLRKHQHYFDDLFLDINLKDGYMNNQIICRVWIADYVSQKLLTGFYLKQNRIVNLIGEGKHTQNRFFWCDQIGLKKMLFDFQQCYALLMMSSGLQ